MHYVIWKMNDYDEVDCTMDLLVGLVAAAAADKLALTCLAGEQHLPLAHAMADQEDFEELFALEHCVPELGYCD
jgi:hypothetical protein